MSTCLYESRIICIILPVFFQSIAISFMMILDKDNSIQQKTIKFCDLFDLKYNHEASAAGFYDQYRNLVIASLKKKGDTIGWQNNMMLAEDEQLSPTFEEMILANVLGLIHTHLPKHVSNHYCLMGSTNSLMDYQSDILIKVPGFLTEIEKNISAFTRTASTINEKDQLER